MDSACQPGRAPVEDKTVMARLAPLPALCPRPLFAKPIAFLTCAAAIVSTAFVAAAGDDGDAPRLAATSNETKTDGTANRVPSPRHEADAPKLAAPASVEPIAAARALIAECKVRYEQLKNYTCTFYKRERIGGKLTPQYVMAQKVRTKPLSVYLKFIAPNPGREAIYVAGRHNEKVLVHDVGFTRLLTGTVKLDPRGSMAMQDCRHPITEAGMGHMIDTIDSAWERELRAGESEVVLTEGVRVGGRPCTRITSVHPKRSASYLFHMVKVYIDDEHRLPIRFEAYDWPRTPGAEPELVEEYTYAKLRVNVGLTERDFDASNREYSFGRF